MGLNLAHLAEPRIQACWQTLSTKWRDIILIDSIFSPIICANLFSNQNNTKQNKTIFIPRDWCVALLDTSVPHVGEAA